MDAEWAWLLVEIDVGRGVDVPGLFWLRDMTSTTISGRFPSVLKDLRVRRTSTMPRNVSTSSRNTSSPVVARLIVRQESPRDVTAYAS